MALPFTEQQSQCLKYLREQRRAAVFGCAGSGKTRLLSHLAGELASGGARTLLICRNPFLALQLRKQLKDTRVAVFAFNELMDALKQAMSHTSAIPARSRPVWEASWSEHTAPTAAELSSAVDHLAHHQSTRFDAVLVDEGQDFEASWLDVAEACLADPPESRFYLFLDDNPLLIPFDTKHMVESIRAPVTLTQNLRSAPVIASLVVKLRPEEVENSRQAGTPVENSDRENGTVQEWLYSGEKDLFEKLRTALLAAERVSPRLEDAVVLSAETNPSRLSKLAGFVFETPGLSASAPRGGLPWRSAVLRYLQGFGLLESDLSAAPLPTREDVQRVNRFCAAHQANHRKALARQPYYGSRLSLRWNLGIYGDLTLRWSQDETLEVPRPDLIKFFGTAEWASTLPPGHKRYRLSPSRQLPPHPFYQDVLLADLPSFKGLEAAAVVFVACSEFSPDHDELLATLYLAFSRARSGLMIVSPGSA